MNTNKKFALVVATAMMAGALSSMSWGSAEADSVSTTYIEHDCSSGVNTTYTIQLNDYANAISTYGIIDDNDMVPSSDTAVVHLSYGGTGFIIGRNTIATVAHAVYNASEGYLDDLVISVMGDDGNPLKDSDGNDVTFSPASIHIPANYLTNEDPNDYAIIELNSNVNLNQYGRFNLGVALDSFTATNALVTASGFPLLGENDPKPEGGYAYKIRYEATGNILNWTYHSDYAFKLFYTADAVGGDSGGPVYLTETLDDGTTYKTVLAIQSDSGGTFNCGMRITPSMLAFFKNNSRL